LTIAGYHQRMIASPTAYHSQSPSRGRCALRDHPRHQANTTPAPSDVGPRSAPIRPGASRRSRREHAGGLIQVITRRPDDHLRDRCTYPHIQTAQIAGMSGAVTGLGVGGRNLGIAQVGARIRSAELPPSGAVYLARRLLPAGTYRAAKRGRQAQTPLPAWPAGAPGDVASTSSGRSGTSHPNAEHQNGKPTFFPVPQVLWSRWPPSFHGLDQPDVAAT
jgi:hypothetical protein